MKYVFPKNFYWGAGTSAHQVEGGNVNDWTEWEKEHADELAKNAGGKWQKWQQEKFPEMFDPQNYISGRACEHYSRFEEDFDIAKELGHNAHRFSIEWSRIEPEEGKFDEDEIEHYKRVVGALRERGIEPFVTLWHWTLPLWVAKQGGWASKKTVSDFSRYTEKVASAFGGDIKFWITFNEPNIYAGIGGIKGLQPPGKLGLYGVFSCYKNLARAHKNAYKIIHKINKETQVGFSNSVIYYPSKMLFLYDFIWNKLFIYLTRGCHDFLGLNYYTRGGVKLDTKIGGTENVSDLGWGIYPEGICHIVKSFKKYKLPIYITENGLADAKDEKRAKFITNHLSWLAKAMEGGCDVRGYLHWSFLDNHEFVEMRGFWPRFGLVEVDYKTMRRKIRPSALEYKKIIENNALEI